jgi:hypothetical protein
MKTRKNSSIIVIFAVLGLFGLIFTACSSPEAASQQATGTIYGNAYLGKNTESGNHGGIAVTLERTDGLRSLATVSTAQNIASGSRTIVRSIAYQTTTQENGSYTFTGVIPGTYTVYAFSPNTREKAVKINVTLPANERSVTAGDMYLTPVGYITGQITVNGGINSGLLIAVASTSYMAVTDNSGDFTINDVPEGTYTILIMKGSYVDVWASNVTVNADQETRLTSKTIDATDIGGGIIWQGESATAPANPQLNWAYYNTTDNISYIWNGTNWDVLAAQGATGETGVSIIWQGEHANEGLLRDANGAPQLNWAYYNTTDNTAYIWNGTNWDVLAVQGATGETGVSVVWKGEYANEIALRTAIGAPQLNWAYYNIYFNTSYIWNGTKWDILAAGNTPFVNIANLRATFPVLNFALDLFDINKYPTYVNLDRKNTFEYNMLPSNTETIPGTQLTNNALSRTDDFDATVAFINSVYTANNNTKFNLYACDLDLSFIIWFLVNNNVPEQNYSVTCYMDGTGSYIIPRYRYNGANAKTLFEDDVSRIKASFQTAKDGGNWRSGFPANASGTRGTEYQDYCLAVLAALNNVIWNVDSISNLKLNLPNLADEVQSLIDCGKIVEENISTKVEKLRAKGKIRDFEYLLKLRWGEGAGECIEAAFDKGNSKKTLMILGTRTEYESAGDGTYNGVNYNAIWGYKLIGSDGFLQKCIDRYGGEYNIFYKGHPSTPTGGEKKTWLDANGIIDILATIPAETIMYLYDGVYIGGYPGTTFLSSLEDQCIVVFGTVANFDSVIGAEYLDLFTETEFMYKNPDGSFFVGKRPE